MIRDVKPQDATAITKIYNEYITNSIISFETEPLTEEDMLSRIVQISSKYPYLVYETGGIVVGYCYAHAWKERAAYRYTAETTVYLSPAYTGRGIGTLLMQKLIEEPTPPTATGCGHRMASPPARWCRWILPR